MSSDLPRILVVDDEESVRESAGYTLEQEGFEVEEAYDGEEGLKRVKANPPDAIVLDVMMPEKDGYAVCAELKADERYADIPVVLLTAVASHVPSTRYTHYSGMTMDADDYLAKPASAEQILQSLKKLLKI